MAPTIEDTLLHAMFYARHLSRCEPRHCLGAILMELDLPAHRVGFQYIKEAILIFYEDPIGVHMKGIYQAVGQRMDPPIEDTQIEQDMRDVIRQAWKHSDDSVWKLYFPQDPAGRIKRPSNSEFVSRIACFLDLWQGCCKEVSYEQ